MPNFRSWARRRRRSIREKTASTRGAFSRRQRPTDADLQLYVQTPVPAPSERSCCSPRPLPSVVTGPWLLSGSAHTCSLPASPPVWTEAKCPGAARPPQLGPVPETPLQPLLKRAGRRSAAGNALRRGGRKPPAHRGAQRVSATCRCPGPGAATSAAASPDALGEPRERCLPPWPGPTSTGIRGKSACQSPHDGRGGAPPTGRFRVRLSTWVRFSTASERGFVWVVALTVMKGAFTGRVPKASGDCPWRAGDPHAGSSPPDSHRRNGPLTQVRSKFSQQLRSGTEMADFYRSQYFWKLPLRTQAKRSAPGAPAAGGGG